jgi:hypothetical protein
MTPHAPAHAAPAALFAPTFKKFAAGLCALALVALLPALAAAQTPAEPGQLIISEFRLRGWDGAQDEYVEIYNATDTAHTVSSVDASDGYALAVNGGGVRFVIPNGTVIPARSHYLGVNADGYSLAAYPAGNGTTAVPDAAYIVNIPDNAGIALFRTSNPGGFTMANRLDAVGSTAVLNPLYREGAGLPTLVGFSINYTWYRDPCGVPANGFCANGGFPQDTDDNAADFLFGDINGTSAGAGQRLAAPGPENLSSPGRLNTNPGLFRVPLDPNVALGSAPNRERSFVPDPARNSTFGTVTFRRTFTNDTHASVKRLRFRIIDLTTFPAPVGTADLRPRDSRDSLIATSQRNVNVRGTTLEEPPAQPHGGGFNSSFGVRTVTLAAPLAPGQSVSVQFLFGIQQAGAYRFAIVAETLPFMGSEVWVLSGHTETDADTEGSN